MLPGLVDSHINPIDIADLEGCDLDNRPLPLHEVVRFVAQCLERFKVGPGQWLHVQQWNYSQGNQPEPGLRTVRAALDAASPHNPVQLLGEDGHHGAFNSAALALAKNAAGQTVGLSKRTLASDFTSYSKLVGVDPSGEPDGAVNEDARYSIDKQSMLYLDLEQVLKVPEHITERLSSSGITAVLDAMAAPEGMPVYDKLLATGKLTARVTLAQFFDPDSIRTADGQVDYERILASARAIRAKYASSPLIRADVVKIFADGGLEGNPLEVPPTLPNGASLRPYRQPIFALDSSGRVTVTSYVDTGSVLCQDVRADAERFTSGEGVGAFMRAHGFHPAQCAISDGQLQHDRGAILEYARRMHQAGFSLHIHVIGDRAAHTAIDAIEAARASDGITSTRDTLAHLELADPADVERIGRDHLFVAFTYAWMNAEPDYDLTVIPFLDEVRGNSYEALHKAGGYYESNAYPVRAVKQAGGILTAGSDAPVDTRDPRPFVNMTFAVTRHIPGQPALGAQHTITLGEVIEAYTINGARMLNLDGEIGSIEVGKSADFVVLDRDILSLAETGHADDIARTRVLATWFEGREVYAAPATPTDKSPRD